jgi:hypothetical protein
MPRIQLYSNGDVLIPVESTVKRNGFVCPWTKKLFVRKRDYVTHLKSLRKRRMHKKARQLRDERHMQTLWNVGSFQEMIDWVETNSTFIFERLHTPQSGEKWAKLRDEFQVKITYLSVQHGEHISNSHNAPRGKPTNWGRQPGLPRGYPGWGGRIEFQVLPLDNGINGSSVGRLLRLHTGTGGGISGGYYGYDVCFFEEDWPGLSKAYSNLAVMAKLSDEPPPNFGINYGVKRY